MLSRASISHETRVRGRAIAMMTIGCALTSLVGIAATTTVFGPQTFRRTQGPPVTVGRTFRVTHPAPLYTLRVTNHGVTSATIALNGRRIVGSSDLHSRFGERGHRKRNSPDDDEDDDDDDVVQTLDRSVTLKDGVNEIRVQLRGRPGTSLTVEIFTAATDTTPPVITAVASPAPNANGWNNAPVTVTFVCSDAGSGIRSCPPPVTVSAEGADQAISGTAVDNAGNSATATAHVSLDKTPPAVTATRAPAANANGWNNAPVVVTFAATDALSGVAPDGLTPPVTLSADGANLSASGQAVDRAGNIGTATLSGVNIDRAAPSITATLSPASNANAWNNTDVTVTFRCSDTGSGNASCPLPITVSAEGANQVISGTAVDKAGNSATATAHVSLDKTPPVVTATRAPAANANGWNNAPVVVTFVATDPLSGVVPGSLTSPATLSADGLDLSASGQAIDLAGNIGTAVLSGVNIDRTTPTITATLESPPNASGWFNAPVAVHFNCDDTGSGVDACPPDEVASTNGVSTISATVTDKAGNTASVTTDPIRMDFGPPSIAATLTPAPNANGWNNTPVTVSFTCADAGAGVATCPPDQTVSTDGFHQLITGTAIDNVGNTASASVAVSIDTAPPVLTLAVPPSLTVFTSPVNATGTVVDSLSGVAGVTCNNASAAVADARVDCSIALTPGANSLTATATDLAGNSASSTLSLEYKRLPVVTITTPANRDYLSMSPTTVSGTVDDPMATVTINSVAAVVAGGSFTVALPLAEGPNVITASAALVSGGTSTASVQVTLDTTPPHVTITSPPDQFVTTDASIAVSGNINDIVVGTVNDTQAQVTVNGDAAQVANRMFLKADVPLVVGPNVIQAVGRDRVGNAATTQITVTRQAVATDRHIVLDSGNNQTGAVGTTLPQPLVVVVSDAVGGPIRDTKVIFKVTQNDGVIAADGGTPAATAIATTGGDGRAHVQWTVGNRAGAGGNGVEAYAVGFDGTALFTATGTQGPAGKIVVDTGSDQVGAISQPLPKPFIAVVIDDGNNRLGGVAVTFTVAEGGGSFDGRNTVTVETDSDGRAATTLSLGMQEGNANNVVEATFPSNSGFPAAFTASGRAPGDPQQTVVSGVVLDNSNAPIPGVTVRAVLTNELHSNAAVVQLAVIAQTDARGQFSIPGAPVGLVKLLVDGSTAQLPGVFPTLEYDIVTVAGQDNTVGQPIYLLPLSTENQLCVTAATGGGTLTIPEAPGFSLTFGPGQVTFPGGSKDGCVSVTVVHGDKVPMVPGFGQQPRFIVTIQPAGAIFSPPAPLTLPNVDGLRPREVTEMYSFDHDIGSFVAIGTGTVSDDGLVIRTTTGVGVLKAGWHCGGNPSPTGTAANCATCQKCIGTTCAPDDSQSPPQTPNDCKKDKCQGGGIVKTSDDTDHDADSCCYQGNNIPKQPIADLAQCPDRTAGPWTFDYDGCSLQPLPGFFRNNPAGGFSTLFSDDHLQPFATHQYACDEHDRCYQTCAGQDMVGGQEICDGKLKSIALSTCTGSLFNPLDVLSGASGRCFLFAEAYYKGLSSTGFNLGKSAYEIRQQQVCKCCQ